MKNSKAFKKLAASVAAVCFSAALVFAAPVATISAQAATPARNTASTRAQCISYVYSIKDNKLYKRLYNYTTGEYLGDWIYVRDLDD
jgi:hypothetical protein